jgi:hypothetical protein
MLPLSKRVLAVLDLETDPFKFGRVPEPFLCGLKWKDNYKTFLNISDAISFLKQHNFICYAHNGGKFDYMFFLKYLESGSKLKLINGRLSEFPLGKSLMRDSFCRYPMALKTHRKTEIEYWKMEKVHRGGHWDEINAYLREDCESLYELMSYAHEHYGTGLTIAGSAMKFWQAQSGVKACRSNAVFYKDFEPFYFGGRVECYQYGVFNKKIKSFDINSAYPFAMIHPHPWGLKYSVDNHLPKSGLHRCLICVEAPSLGYWPVPAKLGGTEFPSDGLTRIFNISSWEYQTVMEFHPELKHKIVRVFQFEEQIEFQKYVDHFYRLKAKAAKNSPEYLFAKLMMNSLYGKFGADPSEYRDYMIVPPEETEYWEACTKYERLKPIHPWMLMDAPLTEEAQHYYNVATAASITGFPRAQVLLHLVKTFGRKFYENRNLYHVDTDGIQSTRLNCEIGKSLGQWNIEFEGNRAGYIAPKTYVLQSGVNFKFACKGVRLSPQQLFKISENAETSLTWKNPAPTMSVKGGIRFIKRKIQRKDGIRAKRTRKGKGLPLRSR